MNLKSEKSARARWTRGLVAILAILMLLAAAHPLRAQTSAVIRVGVYNFEPLIFVDKDGVPKGIYLDVLAYIAAREGWQIEYVSGTWQECLTRLENGELDVLPSIGYTEERAQKLDFTNEYLFLDWGMVYRGKGKPIQTVLDLKGKKIAALKGSIYTQGLTKLLEQFDLDNQIIEKNEYTEVLSAVDRGEVDAGIITKVYGLVLESRYTQIEPTDIFFAPVKILFAVPKGKHAALLATLDRYFAALKADQNSIYYASLEKWIGIYRRAAMVPTELLLSFGGALFLLALFFGASVVLRRQVAEKTRSLVTANAEVHQTKEQYRALVENIHEVIFTLDVQGRFVYVSPAIERLVAYTQSEIIGQPLGRFVHPADLLGVQASLARTFEGKFEPYEFRVLDKNNCVLDVQMHNRVRLENGKPVSTTGVLTDITARKRVEQTLRESEASLRESQRVARVGHWSWDTQMNQVVWSDEMKRIFGLDPVSFSGDLTQIIAQAIHPDDQSKVNAANQSVLWEQKSAPLEYRIVLPDQSVRTVLALPGDKVADESGKILKLTGIVQDITERKSAEEEIRKLNAELEQRVIERTAELKTRVGEVEQLNHALGNLFKDLQLAHHQQANATAELAALNNALQAKNRELETFTYSVSHDLKAPLRGIDGYSRLLLADHAGELNDEGRVFLQTIRRATEQMSRLIDDLLAYSRLERRAITPGDVNLQTLIDAVIMERADDLRRQKVAITREIPDKSISTDADGLALVLRNLLDNALKFTRDAPAPRIEIGGREDATGCVLWVRDNGIGFDLKYHDRIFEIFQRLHRAEDYSGTGIGLAIVRKALERMGGRAWAESAPGQGATFYVEIPR